MSRELSFIIAVLTLGAVRIPGIKRILRRCANRSVALLLRLRSRDYKFSSAGRGPGRRAAIKTTAPSVAEASCCESGSKVIPFTSFTSPTAAHPIWSTRQ